MLDRIHKFLKNNGVENTLVEDHLVIDLMIGEQPVRLSATLGKDFPRSLPTFHLLERSQYGALAHVGWNPNPQSPEFDKGLVCEGVSVSRSIDFDSPEQVFCKAMEQVRTLLAGSLLRDEKNRHDIQMEFAGHWAFAGSQSSSRVMSFIEPGDSLREIQSLTCTEGVHRSRTILIDVRVATVNEHYELLGKLRTRSQVEGKAIYLPVTNELMPPCPGQLTMDWWKSYLETQNEHPGRSLADMARRVRAVSFWVLGSVRTVADRNNWFAIRFKSKEKTNIPVTVDNCKDWTADAVSVVVHNREFLLPRGGASTSSGSGRIAVVGCGSVGGEVARLLASSGVDKLTLVDPESYEIENIYRHTLGSGKIGVKKTTALAEELQAKFPYLSVKTREISYLEHCLDEEFLEEHKGIVVATGDATAERYFDAQLRTSEKRPWVIYCWVEGLGVGGHAVYVHSTGQGCLGCLFRDGSGNRSLASIQNFIAPEQEIAIDIAGCGTHFLPYSYTDAVQSAILAVRLAQQALEGRLDQSCRISWKGNVELDPKIRTTHRFEVFDQSLAPMDLHWEGCNVCTTG